MKILVDADGCPVVDITIEISKKYGVECILICDTTHEFNKDGAKTVVVEKGADSADFKLVNMLSPGDVAVTQDYGLAAMCLARGAVPINQNGLVYDNSNIDELLFSRYVSKKVRRAGGRLKGPPARSAQQDEKFKKSLCALLDRLSSN